MVKNVKIDENTHRKLRIKAAELDCRISDLCSVLVTAALLTISQASMRELLANYSPGDDDPNQQLERNVRI